MRATHDSAGCVRQVVNAARTAKKKWLLLRHFLALRIICPPCGVAETLAYRNHSSAQTKLTPSAHKASHTTVLCTVPACTGHADPCIMQMPTEWKIDFACTCRAREKINRPQTRRRRENNEDSVDKMQAIRRNLKKAWELLEYVTRREERKRSLVVCHQPRGCCSGVEGRAQTQPGGAPPFPPVAPRRSRREECLSGRHEVCSRGEKSACA